MILLAAAALAIPAQFHGLWAENAELCPPTIPGDQRNLRSEGVVAVRPEGIDFFASTTTPLERIAGQNDFTFESLTEEEGEFAGERIALRRVGEALSITRDGEEQIYVHCPSGPD